MPLALRAYLRYLAPLALLSAVIFAPYLWLAWHTPVPPDGTAVHAIAKLAWLSLAYVGAAQLLLVGAATPITREPRLTQVRALTAGARQLVRAAVPCAIAMCAVIAGGLALALPGLALLALFSLTATSEAPGLPAPLVESALVVRRQWRRVVPTLVAIAVVDAGIVFACQHFLIVSPAKKPITPAELAMVPRVVHLVALGFALLSPLAACLLAAIRASDTRPDVAPDPEAEPSTTSEPPEEAEPR